MLNWPSLEFKSTDAAHSAATCTRVACTVVSLCKPLCCRRRALVQVDVEKPFDRIAYAFLFREIQRFKIGRMLVELALRSDDHRVSRSPVPLRSAMRGASEYDKYFSL